MAHNNRIVAFDNLSYMPQWLSDALCRLATGSGDAYRAHYSNDEEFIFDAKRPIILNGIEEVATRGDLLDRSLTVNLPFIDPKERKDEKTYWKEANEARPRILGALLDAVSMALRNLSSVKVDELPRMADFALWVLACEELLGPKGTFLAAYTRNRGESIAVELEASPVASALIHYMQNAKTYVGTASQLLESLKACTEEETTRLPGWPKNARSLSGKLKRLAPSLRQKGLSVILDRDNNGSLITVTKIIQADPGDAKHPQDDANLRRDDAKKAVSVTPSDLLTPVLGQNGDASDANGGYFSNLDIREKEKKKEQTTTEGGGKEKYADFASLASFASPGLNGHTEKLNRVYEKLKDLTHVTWRRSLCFNGYEVGQVSPQECVNRLVGLLKSNDEKARYEAMAAIDAWLK